MPEIQETSTPPCVPTSLTSRIAHADTVAKGIESFRQECAKIMCGACLGAGGWGEGEGAFRCEKCEGTGSVAVPERKQDCPVCDGTGSAFGKRCAHLEVES
jgi:DnaJ-class molecular chaperone